MPQSDRLDEGPAPSPSAFQAGSPLRDDCRAARIDEITEFAECLGKADQSCPHRMTFSTYLYCLHPQREAIIARTLARQKPPCK